MGGIFVQTKLELFYKMQIQKTIPEYVSIMEMRVHDRCVSIRSTRNNYGSLVCPFIKRSHVSRSFSYIMCNYSDKLRKQTPGPCYICPMKRIQGVWVPARTECRDTEWHVMPNHKFWNWQKE